MTNHTNCLHPATAAGRASCRKAASVRNFHDLLAAKVIASGEALCGTCFWNATESAAQNIADDKGQADWNDQEAWAIRRAEECIAARSYLFDDGALSACSDHQHLL